MKPETKKWRDLGKRAYYNGQERDWLNCEDILDEINQQSYFNNHYKVIKNWRIGYDMAMKKSS